MIRTVKMRKGNGAIDTYSIKYLFPLEFPQQPGEPEGEFIEDIEQTSSQDITQSPQQEENVVIWICPACNRPEDTRPMIACDRCDD